MARKAGNRAVHQPPEQIGPDIVDPRLRRLHAYWHDERGSRALPSRTDIDPAALRFVLGYLVLVDVCRDPVRFRIRLQGTELGWWIGADLTGKTLESLRAPELRSLAAELLMRAVESGAPLHKVGEEMIGDLPRRYEALLLPLASDGINVNMVLAAVLCRDDRQPP